MITELTTTSNKVWITLPLPQINVTIRPGVMSDVPFLDSLQKLHTKQVGWMPTAQFEGKIRLGHVLIAEENTTADYADHAELKRDTNALSLSAKSAKSAVPTLVGYCIGNDQYFKRDDVGIIYQMNVMPGKQRGFIGASLLKAQFERSAYGCKLYCCWCAQDIAANHFWEAMGFVALAFRAGSAKKSRTHIFWQKRIRSGDTTTPWWFPSKTAGGSIREDRIVLPIPPGKHWSDAKPMILPGDNEPKALANGVGGSEEPVAYARGLLKKRAKKDKPIERPAAVRRNGLMFDIPKQGEPLPEEQAQKASKEKTPRVKTKNDPRLVAAARELRDRWLEEVNAGRYLPAAEGKYEVSRQRGLDAMAISMPEMFGESGNTSAVAVLPALPAPAIAA